MGSGLGPDWTELTRECLLNIFSRLSMQERWNGPMLVCKTLMNVCQDPSLNTIFDLETQFLSIPESINLWTSEFEAKVDSTLQSVVDQSQGGLIEIRVRHCTNQSISYVAERCPNLEVLWIKYSPRVTVESIRKIALNCPKLKELDISFEISCDCMEMVGNNCKNFEFLKRNMMDPWEVERLEHTRSVPYTYLEDLSIMRTMTLGNVDVYTIVRHMRQLKHLELRFSTLTDIALDRLCKTCTSLEYLDLFGCRNLTSDGVTNSISRLKNLKDIKKPDFEALVFDY